MMKTIRKVYESFARKPLSFEGQESLTKQSFKEECDINNILKKFNKTGQLPDMIRANPRYGDFSDVPTYQESLNIVHTAQEQFSALPARVRERFLNNPVMFLEFVQNPANQDELVAMGIAKKQSAPEGTADTPKDAKTPESKPANA